MHKALQKYTGKIIRLYTISGVESYLGQVLDLDESCVTLKDAVHGELMHIALQHVECFHEAKISVPSQIRSPSLRFGDSPVCKSNQYPGIDSDVES